VSHFTTDAAGEPRIEYDEGEAPPTLLPLRPARGKDRVRCLPCRGLGFQAAAGDDVTGRTKASECKLCHGWGVRDLPHVTPHDDPDRDDFRRSTTPEAMEASRRAREPSQCRDCGRKIYFALLDGKRHAYSYRPHEQGTVLLAFDVSVLQLKATPWDGFATTRNRYRPHSLDCPGLRPSGGD
jgi:hypothetical protein